MKKKAILESAYFAASEGCNGDPNAELSDCITACPRTCENQEDDPFCPISCDAGGCVCKPEFVLNTNGSCIKPEECIGTRNLYFY